MSFSLCKRCGKWAYERLRTHEFCWDCDYTPENDVNCVPWTALEYRNSKIAAQRRHEDERIYAGFPGGFNPKHSGGEQ